MLINFIVVSLRNIRKHSVSSFISVGSLSLGILFALVIFKFTSFERSFDRSIPDHQDKVRLNFSIENGGRQTVSSATAPYPYTDLFVSQSPEIEKYVLFYDHGEGVLTNSDQETITTHGIAFSDEGLFDFFGLDFVEGGDISEHDLRGAVISKSLSDRLYGNESPIDKTITFLGAHQFVIKGVFNDAPSNSSVQFHFVVPTDFLQTLRPAYYQEGQNWGGYAFHTYYQLSKGTDLRAFEEKITQQSYDRFEITEEDMQGEIFGFNLTKVADIHLKSDLVREQGTSGSESRVRMLEFLSFVILAIAWINFINMQATKAPQRLREIGVRRVFGAGTKSLYTLFFIEFLTLNVLSLGISVGLLSLFNSYLPGLAQVELNPSVFPIQAHPWLAAFIFIGILISSVYPALVAIRSTAGLKSTYVSGRNSFLRKGLVAGQIAVSMFMIAYTLTVFLQVRHMINQNPGFDASKVLMINGPMTQSENDRANAEVLKQMALRLPGVELATWGGASPGVNQGWQGNIREMDSPDTLYQTAYFSNITNDYFDVFGIQILAGRIPLQNTPHTEPRLVVNQQALAGWGWDSPEDAIGKRIGYGSGSTVVAVVENFNSLGFQNQIDPRVFIVDHLYRAQTANDFFLLKVDPRQISNITSAIQTSYERIFPGNAFDYSFVDEEFQKLYHSEMAYNKIFSLFSGLAIFLACIGMLGMARYGAISRKREIGIRKTLGSGQAGIVRLLLTDYIWLVLLAFIISTPVSYLLIDSWLDAFAYRIGIGVFIFLIPLVGIILMTLTTVGGISYKAALANPVEVLKEL